MRQLFCNYVEMKDTPYKGFTNYPGLPKAKDNGVFLHHLLVLLNPNALRALNLLEKEANGTS